MNITDLKQFAETYFALEEKAHKIIEVYSVYSLDSIEVEEYQGKTVLNINTSAYFGGCNYHETLTFELKEIANDISYFKELRKTELAEKKEAEKKIRERTKIEQEARDMAKYELLKERFEKK